MLDNTTELRCAEAIELTSKYQKYVGRPHIGTPAPGERIDVNTPLHPVQRPLKRGAIEKYIEMIGTVDWNMFGYATAVEIEGEQFIIDAQHRISLVKTLSPHVTTVPAHIIRIDKNDKEYAAKLFAYLNGVASSKPSQEEILWAELIAREPHAIRIESVLIQAGLSCGMINEGYMEISRSTIEKCMKLGIPETLYAAELIKKMYPKRKDCNQLFHGMVTLLSITEYSGLMKNLTLGKMFKEWTIDFSANNSYEEAKFKSLQPTNAWNIGVAYGLMKKFRHWMDNKDKLHHVPAKEYIFDAWKKASQRTDE
tara:strand:+ start:315 stop:1244 length:930 start_codon:yes stop_codon:yes gene_type:complete